MKEIDTKAVVLAIAVLVMLSCDTKNARKDSARPEHVDDVAVLTGGDMPCALTWVPSAAEASLAVDIAYAFAQDNGIVTKGRNDYVFQAVGVAEQAIHINILSRGALFSPEKIEVLGEPDWRNYYMTSSEGSLSVYTKMVSKKQLKAAQEERLGKSN